MQYHETPEPNDVLRLVTLLLSIDCYAYDVDATRTPDPDFSTALV